MLLIMVNCCCTHDFSIFACTGMYSTVRTYQNGVHGVVRLGFIYDNYGIDHSNNIKRVRDPYYP